MKIDKSKFGKRKYNVVGGCLSAFAEKHGSFLLCQWRRETVTLFLQVIKDKIKHSTTIISDCWKAYKCLELEAYKHLSGNHNFNFVDPNSKVHTNTIDRKWRYKKKKKKKKKLSKIWMQENSFYRVFHHNPIQITFPRYSPQIAFFFTCHYQVVPTCYLK